MWGLQGPGLGQWSWKVYTYLLCIHEYYEEIQNYPYWPCSITQSNLTLAHTATLISFFAPHNRWVNNWENSPSFGFISRLVAFRFLRTVGYKPILSLTHPSLHLYCIISSRFFTCSFSYPLFVLYLTIFFYCSDLNQWLLIFHLIGWNNQSKSICFWSMVSFYLVAWSLCKRFQSHIVLLCPHPQITWLWLS